MQKACIIVRDIFKICLNNQTFCSADVYVLCVGVGSKQLGETIGINLPVYPLKVVFGANCRDLAAVHVLTEDIVSFRQEITFSESHI